MSTTNEATGIAEEALYRCPGIDEMAAFDALPKPMRDALNYAPGNLSARGCLETMRSGLPPMVVLAMAHDALREHYGRESDGWGTRRHKRCRR